MGNYEPLDLKNIYVGRATRDHVETILSLLELEFVTILSPRDLVAMLRRATDTHYVATEAAYTADRRDTDRALHTALYLTRCTGCPAHAVISSVKNDPEVQVQVDAGTVQWLRLTHKDLNPDGRGPAIRPEYM